jgi:predicted GNAT family N-acyltransferase
LHAQTHALGFYERYGFRAEGAEFIEAGIPHFRMVRILEEQKQ